MSLSSRVAVVIVTYNSADVVLGALSALGSDLHDRVVVVDNASTDDTCEVITAAAPAVRVCRSSTNLGFGSAVNVGTRQTPPADYVLVLNPDAQIDPGDLLRLVDHLDTHPRSGVVVPRLWRAGSPLCSAKRRPRLLTELWPVAPAALMPHLPTSSLDPSFAISGPVEVVEGACMLLRREAFDAVGGFDEGYFLYFEEADLAKRLSQLGWTCDLCAEARAEHLVGDSRKQVPYGAAPHFVSSTVRYLQKWEPRSRARAYVVFARLSWSVRRRWGGLEPALAAAFRAALPDARP